MIVRGVDISDCVFIEGDNKRCHLECLSDECPHQQIKQLKQVIQDLTTENNYLKQHIKQMNRR